MDLTLTRRIHGEGIQENRYFEGIQSYGYREEIQNMERGKRGYRIWREEGGDTIIWIQGGDTIIWIQGGDTEYGERKEGIQEYGYNEVGPRKYKGDVKIKISKKNRRQFEFDRYII